MSDENISLIEPVLTLIIILMRFSGSRS